MSPQELINKLSNTQMCATELIVSLTQHNHDVGVIIAALYNCDNDAFARGFAALRKSCKCIADSLERYCESTRFISGGSCNEQ